MFNVLTKETSFSGNYIPVGTSTLPWKALKGTQSRVNNDALLTFGTQIQKQGTHVSLSFGRRMMKAQNCRTEVYIKGKFIGMHRGLQWSLLQATSETRSRGQYLGHSENLNSPAFRQAGARLDFPSVTRYYLVAFDPDNCHATSVTANSYHVAFESSENVSSPWQLSHDGVFTMHGEEDDSVRICTKETGELIYFTSVLSGLDYIRATTEFDGLEITDTLVSDFTDKSYAHATSCREWVHWHFSDALASLEIKNEMKGNVKLRPWTAPIVKYSEQFKEAENVSSVGHLRFARLADAINTGIKPSSVLDLIQWYGIIPVLNVQKEVVIKMSGNYFSHLTNSVCGKTCQHSNLVLKSGQYAIDVNPACFFYGNKYDYPHGKKAWILTALVNGEITIDSNFTDRIVPVGSTVVEHSTIMLEDDDFLNRI